MASQGPPEASIASRAAHSMRDVELGAVHLLAADAHHLVALVGRADEALAAHDPGDGEDLGAWAGARDEDVPAGLERHRVDEIEVVRNEAGHPFFDVPLGGAVPRRAHEMECKLEGVAVKRVALWIACVLAAGCSSSSGGGAGPADGGSGDAEPPPPLPSFMPAAGDFVNGHAHDGV